MPAIAVALQAFAVGFPQSLLHALIALILWLAAAALYAALSPGREVTQVRNGNGAAAVALGGVLLSLALPLGAAMTASAGSVEIIAWGVAVLIVQLLLIRGADLVLRGLPERVREGDVTAAVLLSCARLGGAVLFACAVLG